MSNVPALQYKQLNQDITNISSISVFVVIHIHKCHFLQEGYKSDVTMAMAESLYDEITAKFHHLSSEVVIDDRLQMSIGQRLHSARVSGYPHVVILGKQVVEIAVELNFVHQISSE